ncbi:amidotransferase [Streptomyces sp. F-3]|uniref:Amidotransferase n=1 Tax=Streptomyces thermogriseus TaxID=75292 RepID=A0ABN1SSZ2_9ACTN|nr:MULTISPECIES: hypothetical protein [Streptomyces]MDN5381526.1 hypothetical protein [Streptomyces sp. LB8]GAT81483.1 amidotransferase [Streptomyces sp. F-3]
MTAVSTLLIVVGLFLVGGVISFVRQQMPKSLVVLLAVGAALCLAAGVLRLEVWK